MKTHVEITLLSHLLLRGSWLMQGWGKRKSWGRNGLFWMYLQRHRELIKQDQTEMGHDLPNQMHVHT